MLNTRKNARSGGYYLASYGQKSMRHLMQLINEFMQNGLRAYVSD